jgi:N6-adenosine-specific RNA methylase IME4
VYPDSCKATMNTTSTYSCVQQGLYCRWGAEARGKEKKMMQKQIKLCLKLFKWRRDTTGRAFFFGCATLTLWQEFGGFSITSRSHGIRGAGFYVSGFNRQTELVLVGYKGILKNVLKQEGEYIPTVFYEQRTTHSTKPVTMYEYIEKLHKITFLLTIDTAGLDVVGQWTLNDGLPRWKNACHRQGFCVYRGNRRVALN